MIALRAQAALLFLRLTPDSLSQETPLALEPGADGAAAAKRPQID